MEDNFTENNRRNLFDEELTPPLEFAWEKVEAGIERPRKKKIRTPFYLFFVGGLAVIASILALIFVHTPSDISVAKVTEIREGDLVIKNNHEAITLTEDYSIEKEKQKSTFSQLNVSPSSTDTLKTNKTIIDFLKTQRTFENTENAQPVSGKNKLVNDVGSDLDIKEKNQNTFYFLDTSFTFLNTKSFLDSTKLKIVSLEKRKKNVLQFELSAGTLFTNSTYQTNNELINTEMQTALSKPFAYSLYGGILFQKHKNVFVGTGFRFTELKRLFSYSITSKREVDQESVITQVTFNTFTSEEIVARGSRIDVETLQRTIKKINSLQITELPLIVGYAISKDKWSIRVNGEIGLASIGFSGFVLDDNLQFIDYSKITKHNIRGLGYMYGGGVEINRWIADRTSIGLKCRYADYKGRGRITDFSPRTVGISLGAKFSL